jgi:hypothetical protein
MKFFTLKNGVHTINLDQVIFVEESQGRLILHHSAHGVASVEVKDAEDIKKVKAIIDKNN